MCQIREGVDRCHLTHKDLCKIQDTPPRDYRRWVCRWETVLVIPRKDTVEERFRPILGMFSCVFFSFLFSNDSGTTGRYLAVYGRFLRDEAGDSCRSSRRR